VAFDFDGTLVRSNRLKKACLYEVTKDLDGAGETLDTMHREGLKGDRYDIFLELCRRLGLDDRSVVEHLTDAYSACCYERLVICDEVPGASSLLIRLKERNIPAYIVSATPQQDLQRVIRDRGMSKYFVEVLGRPVAKSQHLRNVLADQDLRSEELLMVGDGVDDVAAANEVGCSLLVVIDDPVSPIREELDRIVDFTHFVLR
jgi:phosphoglycolate phosphatase-like HAD superfamily hydrolase